MSTRLVLCRTPAGGLTSTLPADRDLAAWHAGLTAELARLGPAYAMLLAAPEVSTVGLEWIALGTRAVPVGNLPPGGRQALMTALDSMLADIESHVAGGLAPLLAAAWPALRRLPGENYIHAVDGRPVLAAWGHAPAASPDGPDSMAGTLPAAAAFGSAAPPPRLPYRLLAVFLIAATVFGFLLPGLVVRPFGCASPASGMIGQENAAIAQNAQLTTELAQLTEQAGRQRALCIPPAKPALPQNAWNSGRLDMLSGCWKLTTDITLYDQRTDAPMPIADWRICFDQAGKGEQHVTYASGDTCTGPTRAAFNAAHEMVITEPRACDGSIGVIIGHWICQRGSDSQANCIRTDYHGQSEGVFQR